MKDLTTALLAPLPGGDAVTWLPCRVVALSPLRIDFYSTDTYPAMKMNGATLVVGPGVALMMSPNKPLVLQIG